ncbi:DUF1972 domain-containing protein [Pseudomonadales bacterium]|nr:DUF1972 domain-containing protein [Pseudomonadales bacterium]
MTIAVIGVVGLPARYGGFETLVENLVKRDGGKFLVFCSGQFYVDRPKHYMGAELVYLPVNANGVQSIIYDILAILNSVFRGHRQLLILGVSGTIILPLLKFIFPNINVVTNIDGLEWKRAKWNKLARRFLKYSEELAVRYSSVVVSDNQAIADYVLSEYGIVSIVIAYGGDNGMYPIDDDSSKNQYALSLCRIEPENNVHVILEAFSKIEMELKFVGNWDNSSYGRSLKKQYSGFTNIALLDPIYDQIELHKIRMGCTSYIHGHSAGGTNPSLVEMMHYAKPTLAYDCVFNRATLENQALYFECDATLIQSLNNKDLASTGKCLFEIAKRRYTWDIVGDQYLSLFSE